MKQKILLTLLISNDDLKSARVVPLFKRSDKTEVGYYRPVSILTIFLKYLKESFMTKMNQILLEETYL